MTKPGCRRANVRSWCGEKTNQQDQELSHNPLIGVSQFQMQNPLQFSVQINTALPTAGFRSSRRIRPPPTLALPAMASPLARRDYA